MRDVSRVEYDAALKRFLDAFDAHMVSSVSRRTFGPMVEARRALAALGLDEPPTEAPRTYTCECCEEQTTRPYVHPEEGIDLCAPCVASLPREGVVPPTEPPKACPTHERDEYRRAIRFALDGMGGLTDAELGEGGGARRAYAVLCDAYHAVPAGIPTGASGIDGGTAT